MKTCIFCQQPLELYKEWLPPDMGGKGYAGEPTFIYMCEPCKSQQDYHKVTSELTHYNFRVDLYWLRFNPGWGPAGSWSQYNSFSLGKDPPDDIGNTETILRLDFIPKLTPQNTTVERIKTLLLFS